MWFDARGVLAVVLVATAALQSEPKPDAAPKQDAPKPDAPKQDPSAPAPAPAPKPAQGQPGPGQPRPRSITKPRPPAANVDIPDVDKYRDGQSAAVTHAADLFTLDLTGVDFGAEKLLVVDDQPITRGDVERQLCLMLGANEIDQFVTGVVFQRVKKQLKERGDPVPDTSVTDEDVKKKIDSDLELFGQLGTSRAEREKQIREFGWDRYVELQKHQLEFDGFFLPDPPKEWAEKQKAEAKRIDAEQKQKHAEKEKAEAELAKAEGREPKKLPLEPPVVPDGQIDFVPKITWELIEPNMATALRTQFYLRGQPVIPMYRTQLVKQMRAKLLESVELRLGRPDEPGVAVVCDGQPLLVKDLLALIGAHAADEHTRRCALTELVSLRAADARLTHDHALLSQADGEAAFNAFVKKNSGSFITPEMVVERGYGFSNLWHFREYCRRKKSYENLVTSTISEEKLSAHYDKAARLFSENGIVVAHVLFVPGTDRVGSKPAVDALLAEVGAGKSFAVVARESGKFPDNTDVHGGSISPLSKNRLRNALHESEYLSFLTGYSFSDEVFYSAKERQVLGPVWRDFEPEATGWYVVQPDHYFTTTAPRPPLSDPKTRERALEDLAAATFPRYVNESLARMKIDNPNAKH